MKELEQKDLDLTEDYFNDPSSTWGNTHNPYDLDFSTKVFYSKILDWILYVIFAVIVILAIVIFCLVLKITIEPDFVRQIFDDGSSAPCVYNPITKKFTQ